MAYSDDDLRNFVRIGQERRTVEFKESIPWAGNESKLAKTIMGLANTQDGGIIVIGVSTRDGTARPEGISTDHRRTFHLDAMAAYVNRVAEPSVDFSFRDFEYEGALLLVIVVEEFRDIPVICRSTSPDRELRQATIYVRTHRMPATAPIERQEDLRTLIDLAIEKRVSRLLRAIFRDLGVAMPPPQHDAGFSDA